MDGVVFRELHQFNDERGWLVELFREDEAALRPAMTYMSMTKPGVTRGPHEHHDQSDYFCFFGSFRLYLWDNRPQSATCGRHVIYETDGRPHIAIVPPHVVHAYKNIGSGEGLVLNLPDRLYKGRGKTEPVDEIRYENDPASPFRAD